MEIHVVDPDGVGGDFVRTYMRQVQALTLTPFVDRSAAYNPRTRACVAFIERRDPAHDALLEQYDASPVPVFLVIPDATRAGWLPPNLAKLNAFTRDRYRGNWPFALCDEVLAQTWMRRTQRKVFISYRRSESTAIARQLQRELTNLGYDAFLDEIDIRRAAVISDELKWALNDVDAAVLLATAGIGGSTWVVDEIGFANAQGVAVLGVSWATVPASATRHLSIDQRIVLSDPPPANDTEELTSVGLEAVLAAVLEHRALAIKSRLDSLVPYARAKLGKSTLGVVEARELGDLVASTAADHHFVRVLPHRPVLRQLNEAVRAARREFPAALEQIVCCYPECDPLHDDAQALELFVTTSPPRRGLWRWP